MSLIDDFSSMPSLVLYASTVIIGLVFTSVDATRCLIGQEPDGPPNGLRWALPYDDPSLCTDIEVGGVNVVQPQRPFHVSHYEIPILKTLETMDITEQVCLKEIALGMEDGRIPDNKINASSFYDSPSRTHAPERARLNTQNYASAWCAPEEHITHHQWIQVDFTSAMIITGLITQGRGDSDQWVTSYTVAYGDDGMTWSPVNETDGTGPKEFSGNTDKTSLVNTTTFDPAIYAQFLRILPTGCHRHVSMRFEVVGCSQATVAPAK